MTSGLTRREALVAAGASALALALPGLAAERGVAASARVDVVGAGLSGLACAVVLVQAGVDVRVWEARDRLGGRTLTDTSLVPGKWVECGGEFIDADHSAIRRLCSESGVTLQDLAAVHGPGHARDLVGGRVRKSGWADGPSARLAQRAARDLHRLGEDRLNAMSAAEWLSGAIPGGTGSPFARYQRARITGEYGTDPSALAALWLVADLAEANGSNEMAGGSERYRIHGGTHRLVAALEQRVGAARIVRGTRLTGLVREGSRPALVLTGPGGPRVERPDRAVITLSPGVLRTVNLSRSGFSTPTRKVIRTYGMGTNAKVIIPFSSAAWGAHGWDAEGVSDTALGQTWNSTLGEGDGSSALTSLVGGVAGRTIAGPDHGPAPGSVVRARLALIDRVAPGTRAAARDGAVVHAWANDPYARGSYAAARPGQAGYATIAARPQGPFHFAGEHTSDQWSGFMEGAVQSGQRVAREVLARL
jgi:monoamine oxidase